MDYKELFGEELGTQLEAVVQEKGINLIVDDKEKPNFIPKDRFDEVIQQKNQFKSQVGELTNELDTVKKTVKGNEEFTQQIEAIQSKYQVLQEQHNNAQIDSQIKMLALTHNFKDPDDLGRFLDRSTLKLNEDGSVETLLDQTLSLKESRPYLLNEQKQVNNNSPANPVNVVVSKSIEEQHREAMANGDIGLAIELKNRMFNL